MKKEVYLKRDLDLHNGLAMLKRFEALINDNEEEASARDAAEAFAKVYTKLNSLQEKYGVKIEATITTDGLNIESSKDNLVYRIIIPKLELDEVVDITIPIENALDTAIKKMID